MRWDLFCRVIDNHGDVGVCWRLACDLAARGEAVRLWLDDASALRWMAPDGAAGVELVAWHAPAPALAPQDVVVEAFGCDPPDAFVNAMAARDKPPVWVNLEYLSAEAYVERSHGLASPQLHGAGLGLNKWFFYPGFTPNTGGLLREVDLMARQLAFDRDRWLATQGIERRPGERVVSVFCYTGAPLRELVQALADAPTLLLLTPCAAQEGLRGQALPHALRSAELPWLAQTDYDHLLWSTDLNIVRGEDSLVRAAWSGAPFIWHLYPQHDAAHGAKLEAFAASFGASRVPGLAELWRIWNGLQRGAITLPDVPAWQAATRAWRAQLWRQPDLTHQLLAFVRRLRDARC